MSPSRSETATDAPVDPLRPDDHADGNDSGIAQPALGIVGWARWAWRQLTSMRTALVLLLFLAIASAASACSSNGSSPSATIAPRKGAGTGSR